MKGSKLKWGALALGATFLALAGCDSGTPTTGTNTWTIQGVDGPTLTYSNNVATIYAVFTNLQLSAGATVPIPHMPNSTVEIAPDVQSGGTLMQITVNAADVASLAGANVLPPNELPGGRPLPGVAGGTMPSEAIQVPALDNITFYIGSNVFGMFVPVGHFSTDQVVGTFQYYDSASHLAGDISIVGRDSSGKNSGFLLLINTQKAASEMIREGKLDLNQVFLK